MDAISLYRAQIREFFERAKGERRYKTELLAVPPKKRIVLAMSDVRKYSQELAVALREHALTLLPAFEEVALEISQYPVHIGVSGVLGREKTSPRDLLSSLLGKLVCVEGIVTSSTVVRPKIKKSVHYNGTASMFACKEYRDMNALSILPPTTTVIPKKSLEGNKLDLEYGLSEYISHQAITIQEMPELSPPGQMPRGVAVILENDLAGEVKPGDRVRVYGTYKCVAHIRNMPESLKTAVIANNIEPVQKRSTQDHSVDAVEEVLAREGLDGIVKHIAPSIYGHTEVKKALLLMMIGGEPVETDAGGRIRGDINILMVGDPGVAKSQLLRYILDISPLAVGATGRGASGVGLTAAVVSDPDTNSKKIEAGAMVLADTGVVCIDEFDKMDVAERAAIHEAMEQQTVTIAKGGIHITLNARCSVLAAANPVSGQYRAHLSPRENIRLPESLLTRFDLIFIMEDSLHYDAEVSMHVLNRRMGKAASLSVLTQSEIKLYVQKAKTFSPVLTEEASEYITEEYKKLREEGEKSRASLSRSITARLLESVIRLATAYAKSRFSSTVDVSDAEAAIELIRHSLWRKSTRKKAVSSVSTDPSSISEILFVYRMSNPLDKIISLEKVASLCKAEISDIMPELKQMEKDMAISVSGGMVLFTT
ncbi:DNA replication licensing factor MCM3 [Nematocida sp. AWRm77]|nr:DNA replication licensing factor MCM3 [Nematocida sp. AWRm77]